MNFFEQELRKIVEHCGYIRNPKYVGRSCIGRLDDGIVVKIEFESMMIRDKYNALRVRAVQNGYRCLRHCTG